MLSEIDELKAKYKADFDLREAKKAKIEEASKHRFFNIYHKLPQVSN